MRRFVAPLVMLALGPLASAQLPPRLILKPSSSPLSRIQRIQTRRTVQERAARIEARRTPAAEAADEFRASRSKGREVRRAISKVANKLRWHKKLKSARKVAKLTNKPILWIQALGNLKGFT